MSSLLPFIQDILPMIMPSSVHIAKAADLKGFPLPSQQLESEDEKKIELVDHEVSPEEETKPTSNGHAPAKPTSTARIIRKDAIIDKTDKMCASVITTRPKSASTVQHHGEQDAIIYAVSGRGVLLTGPADEDSDPVRHELGPGDFAFVPAWTEHQALNESEDDEMVWVVIRSGPVPVEVSLTGWGGPQIEQRPKT